MLILGIISKFFAIQISTDTDFITIKDLENVPPRYLTCNNKFIELTCFAGGVTSPNSKTSRTEFREVDEYSKKTYWDSNVCKSMHGQLSVIKLPIIKKSVMFSQIKLKTHGAVMMVFLNTKRVYLVCNTEYFKKRQNLDLDYNLGDLITFNYTVNNGEITIYYRRNYNDPVIVTYNVDFKNAYFKIGN